MKFPVLVRKVSKAPTFNNVGGRTWDFVDVTLPDGTVVNGRQETTWSSYFYFEHDGRWYRAPWSLYEKGGSGRALKYDLRDQTALAAVEMKIAVYEMALRGEDKTLVERLCQEVEELATAAGFNDHRRLAALHSWAERIGA